MSWSAPIRPWTAFSSGTSRGEKGARDGRLVDPSAPGLGGVARAPADPRAPPAAAKAPAPSLRRDGARPALAAGEREAAAAAAPAAPPRPDLDPALRTACRGAPVPGCGGRSEEHTS